MAQFIPKGKAKGYTAIFMNTLQNVRHREYAGRKPMQQCLDLAKLAHDFKGPLNSIKGLLTIASKETKDSAAKQYFGFIEKYQRLLYFQVEETLNKVSVPESRRRVVSQFDEFVEGYKLSLRSYVTVVSNGQNKAPFSEKAYRANTIINIMNVLQNAYGKRLRGNANRNIDIVKLAHDIKGPLNSIKGLLEIARNEVENESAKEYFELIEKCQQQLYARVEETLRRINESNTSPVSQIDFHEMIKEIQASLKHMEGFASIDFKININNIVPFYSDSDAVYSIIQNLVENAIKYRKHDQTDHIVSIELTDIDKGIRLCVTDNGIGIKPEMVSEIFKFKVRDEAAPGDGHGIGLALVKQFVERLDGKILLNSKCGVGTSFTVEIPDSYIPIS